MEGGGGPRGNGGRGDGEEKEVEGSSEYRFGGPVQDRRQKA